MIKEAVLNPATSQVTQELATCSSAMALQAFNSTITFAFDEQIGEIVAENSSILVQNLQWVLLFARTAFLKRWANPFS